MSGSWALCPGCGKPSWRLIKIRILGSVVERCDECYASQAEQIAALPPQTHRMPPRSDQDGSVGTDDRAGRNGEPE